MYVRGNLAWEESVVTRDLRLREDEREKCSLMYSTYHISFSLERNAGAIFF